MNQSSEAVQCQLGAAKRLPYQAIKPAAWAWQGTTRLVEDILAPLLSVALTDNMPLTKYGVLGFTL